MKTIKLVSILFFIAVFCSCKLVNVQDEVFEQDNVKKPEPKLGILKGAWVDKESYALQFIDFFSDTQARFGMYGKNFERYDTLAYRLFDNQIAIRFLSGNDSQETIHNLIKINDETIEISGLTDIPENPGKTYLKRDIITETQNDTIVIGHNQI
jgi:hypothetical protein